MKLLGNLWASFFPSWTLIWILTVWCLLCCFNHTLLALWTDSPVVAFKAVPGHWHHKLLHANFMWRWKHIFAFDSDDIVHKNYWLLFILFAKFYFIFSQWKDRPQSTKWKFNAHKIVILNLVSYLICYSTVIMGPSVTVWCSQILFSITASHVMNYLS